MDYTFVYITWTIKHFCESFGLLTDTDKMSLPTEPYQCTNAWAFTQFPVFHFNDFIIRKRILPGLCGVRACASVSAVFGYRLIIEILVESVNLVEVGFQIFMLTENFPRWCKMLITLLDAYTILPPIRVDKLNELGRHYDEPRNEASVLVGGFV